MQLLLKEGCTIAAYDPAAMPKTQAAGIFPGEAVFFAENSFAAAKDADAVLVLTDWEEFTSLDLERLRAALKHPIMIDGRNLFQPQVMAELGFTYVSIGRPDVAARKSVAVPTPSAG